MILGSTSAGTATSNRITGMVTGLDTDTVVKNLTSATRTRIAAAKQQSELLEWKQDAYRSVISSVIAFKDKYFNSTSATSLLKSGTYNQMSLSFDNPLSSNYLSVTPSEVAQEGSLEIKDIQTATSSVLETNGFVSQHAQLTADFTGGELSLAGKQISFTLAGSTKTITLSQNISSIEDLTAELQAQLNTQFSENLITVSQSGNSVLFNSGGENLTIDSESNAFLVPGMVLTHSSTALIDLYTPLNQSLFATALTGDTFDVQINGKAFHFTSSDTLASVISTVNSSSAGVKMAYSTLTDSITLTSSATGSASSFSFGDTTGNLMSVLTGGASASDIMPGHDAELYINGVKIVRSENFFIIDGLSFDLKASYCGTLNANVSQNTDEIFNTVKGFVDDYNALLQDLNTKLSEKKDRNYLPLTDEQKEDMSEKQIELWESKAKTGLLSNDPTISSMLSAIRNALVADVKDLQDGSSIGISLSGMGIATALYTEKGKLHINETKLKEVLKNNPENVMRLFMQKSDLVYSKDLTETQKQEYYNESGLIQRISDILDTHVKTTREYGSLLLIAGYTGSSTATDNRLYHSIENYDKRIEDLSEKLADEEDRYYKQFAALESSISYMNQQSAWLTQMTNY